MKIDEENKAITRSLIHSTIKHLRCNYTTQYGLENECQQFSAEEKKRLTYGRIKSLFVRIGTHTFFVLVSVSCQFHYITFGVQAK